MSPFTTVTFFLAVSATVFAAPSADGAASLAKRATGRGTYFNVGLGACGETNSDSDKIIAISADIYGNGGHCGQGVSITNTANGKSASATVRDKCPSCGANDIDMSPSLFEELGSLDSGVLTVSWNFN